jgi:aminopeptidase N
MQRLKQRLLAGAGVLLTVGALTLVSTSDATARTARPGAPDVGDYLFPGLGNGGYDAGHYSLKLRYPTSVPVQQVQGVVRMDAVATQDLSSFDLDFGGDAVGSVRVDGRSVRFDWQKDKEELVITPAQFLRRGHGFSVEVAFTAHTTAPQPGDLVPFGWLASAHGSFTSFQPNVAHKSIPVNDHPSDKASWSFELDVPQGITAIANGVRGCQPRSASGRTVWSYEERSPMAPELVQLAVGDDLSIVQRGTVNAVAFRDVIANGRRGLLEPGFADGPAQLQWLTGKLGPFPFAEYGNFGVDQLFGYSLETQGLTMHTYGLFDPAFLPEFGTGQPWFYNPILVHETAHQWFGNSVSPQRWSDVWLNEGPATWFEKEFEQETGIIDEWGFDSFTDYMKAQYAQGDAMRAQYGPVAHPLPRDDNLYFNPNIYDGGALALYALQQQVGDPTFRQILRGWAQQFHDSSRSTDDFISFASQAAGQNLDGFMRAWLYGDHTPPMPGHPDWTVDPVNSTTTATGIHAAARPGGPIWSRTRGVAR